ncbi:MAG: UDP-3-O-acyl-N-acetylglucosamine deacetylase [Nitrospirota bacterium]
MERWFVVSRLTATDFMVHEKTIEREVSFSGVGLHSGKPARIRLLPASQGSGIVFVRTDLGSEMVMVKTADVLSTFYSTTIGADGVRVQTVEHLLAAISALSIDNLFIEVDSEEVPIADGSSAPFVALLLEAGERTQKRRKQVLKIMDSITIVDGEKFIRISPSESFEIDYTIAYKHPLVSIQSYDYCHSRRAFIEEISSARTFGFLSEIKALLANGYAQGGSLENAIVVDEDKILNQEVLRFEDEFVRHKILDLIGDLALLGIEIQGKIEACQSGHQMHTRLIETLRNNKKLSKIVSASDFSESIDFSSYEQVFSATT